MDGSTSTEEDGVPSARIHSLAFDESGQIFYACMRWLARVSIIALGIVLLIIWLTVSGWRNSEGNEEDGGEKGDETIRLLLASDVSSEVVDAGIVDSPRVPVTVAIVLIVSLVSVALLITGIIVVAVTLDPNGSGSDLESEADEEECERDYKFISPPAYFTRAEFDDFFHSAQDD